MAEKVLAHTPLTHSIPETTVPTEHDVQTDTVTIPVKLCNLPPMNSIANQVLLLANSSLFGFTSRMSVLRHAIAVLGLDRIKALAVTVAMRAFLGQGGPLVRQCWRHSAACGVIAEEIS